MGLLDRIFKEQLEAANGRIRKTTGGWCWNPSPRLVAITKACNPTFEKHGLIKELDANGKEMFLVHRLSVTCRNPEICDGNFPEYKTGRGWSVPLSFCKRCKHYRIANRHIKYPHCQFLQKSRGGDEGAIRRTAEMVQEAVQSANKFLKP